MSGDNAIRLSHGSGGQTTRQLLHEVVFPTLGITAEADLDAALLDLSLPPGSQLAFTTDGFVVQPIEFPGGDIGKLAVCGTLNDLAVVGAKPAALALSLILEEGFPIPTLEKILCSIAREADRNNVRIVTGDTKVVRQGEADKIFITTTGIGIRRQEWDVHPRRIVPGDRILASGTLAEHGAAILAARESFGLEGPLSSDCAALWPLIEQLKETADAIHFMRDPTRGGLAAVLHEALAGSDYCAELVESQLPIREEVSAFSEVLGIDPLYLASEGRIIVVVEEKGVETILEKMRQDPLGRQAAEIGVISKEQPGTILLRNPYGSRRFLQNLAED
ncbi:MAG: hydrogenase expression/formation protein HypE, partial [bacterium]